MKLAIVVGGRGTRLGLKEIPKPMVKIGGKPILEHQINLAKSYGIKDVYILSGYQADVIKSYFGDGSTLDINITHITEKFRYIPEDKQSDFGKDIFPLLLGKKQLIRAYKTAEYIKDIGTNERLKEVDSDFI